MTPVSDWTEDYSEARRWAESLRRTVGYASARIRIASHTDAYGRKHYRLEANRGLVTYAVAASVAARTPERGRS